MLSDKRNVHAIDHELAFMGIPYMLQPRKNSWILNSGDVTMVKDGIIISLINGKKFDSEAFVDDIESIKNDFWTKAMKLLPNEWDGELWPQASQFIMGIVNNAQGFVDNTKSIIQ
jgi:hypothetical protein